MPSLGALGRDSASALVLAEFAVDLLAVVTEPGEVGSQRPLWRIWVFGLARGALGLDLGVIFLCLEIDRGDELTTEESGEIELANVEALLATEDGVGVTDVCVSGVSERALKVNPRGDQLCNN